MHHTRAWKTSFTDTFWLMASTCGGGLAPVLVVPVLAVSVLGLMTSMQA